MLKSTIHLNTFFYIILFFLLVSCKTETPHRLYSFTISDLINESQSHNEYMHLNEQYIIAGKYLKKSCVIFFTENHYWPNSYKELQYYTKKAIDLSPLGEIFLKKTPTCNNLKVVIIKKDSFGTATYTLTINMDVNQDIAAQLHIDRTPSNTPSHSKRKNLDFKAISVIEKNIDFSIPPFKFSIADFLAEVKEQGDLNTKPLRLQYARCEKYLRTYSLNFLKTYNRWPSSYNELKGSIQNKIDMSPLGYITIKELPDGSLEIIVRKIDKIINKQINNQILISTDSTTKSQLEVKPY